MANKTSKKSASVREQTEAGLSVVQLRQLRAVRLLQCVDVQFNGPESFLFSKLKDGVTRAELLKICKDLEQLFPTSHEPWNVLWYHIANIIKKLSGLWAV